MYLKVYANHLKGVQVMATFNLQCNSLSQIHSSVYFRLKVVWQVEHTLEKCWYKFGWNPWRNEWVSRQTSECTKREFEKTSGIHVQAHEVCDENERKERKKNDGCLKYYWWQEGVYKARTENSCHGYQTASGQRFFIHWRYYLFSKRVNRCQGDGFSSVGARTGAIKLAMAGT